MLPDQPNSDAPRRPFQFRMVTLMATMVLVSILAALFGGLFRSGSEGNYKSRLVLLTLMAPLALIVLCQAVRLVISYRKRRRPKW